MPTLTPQHFPPSPKLQDSNIIMSAILFHPGPRCAKVTYFT